MKWVWSGNNLLILNLFLFSFISSFLTEHSIVKFNQKEKKKSWDFVFANFGNDIEGKENISSSLKGPNARILIAWLFLQWYFAMNNVTESRYFSIPLYFIRWIILVYIYNWESWIRKVLSLRKQPNYGMYRYI